MFCYRTFFSGPVGRAAALVLTIVAPGCSDSGGSGDGPDDDVPASDGGAGDGTSPDGPDQPPIEDLDPEGPLDGCLPAAYSPTRALARRAQNHLINYGEWSDDEIELAKSHDVVILDPNDDLTRSTVAEIQGGSDPNDPCARVVVLCYVSIGEDHRTANMSDAAFRASPLFVGDGSGPRMDPRGPFAGGQSLSGIDPLGVPSNGGAGWASYYLDDTSAHRNGGVGDGFPDRNPTFGGAYVNAGDPRWFAALQDMTLDGPDAYVGLREALTTDFGRGLGCDGVFLDTIDTAAPNSWSSRTKYEWTAPGFALFMQRLRDAYPDAVILQNRGVFFFHPDYEQYRFLARGNLDFFLFESYRLNSGATDNPDPYYYPDNRFNFTPKLMAEANRPGGFRVLSVGYAEGPVDEQTLVGGSTTGSANLIEDIRVTERLAGFRHYLTNSSLTLVNRFVEDHADRSDLEPPVWTSTYNDHDDFPGPPGEATPRIGVQRVDAGPGALTVRWDVALDLNRVGYAIYYQKAPFDFAANPELTTATRQVVRARAPTSYAGGVGPGVYTNEATVSGLEAGATYHVVVRAFDDSPAANEDANQVVLSGVTLEAAPYLGRLRASNDATRIQYAFAHAGGGPATRRVYIDRDRMTGTGQAVGGIGADLKIEEGTLYRHAGGGAWTALPSPVALDARAEGDLTHVTWELDRDAIGGGYRHTDLVFEVDGPAGRTTSTIHEHLSTSTDPASAYLGQWVANDAERIYLHAEIGVDFTSRHVFLDDDADPTTGFGYGGIGAGYLIANGSLWRHEGPGWAWSYVGQAHLETDGARHDWWISRADVGAAGGSPLFTIVFQAHGDGVPTFVAPAHPHQFSR